MAYSAHQVPRTQEQNPVVARLSGYLDRLFSRVEERVEARIVERVEATIDVMSDPALLADLRRADDQPDEEARPLDEVMRDLDRAKT
jgi:hypothetical protein